MSNLIEKKDCIQLEFTGSSDGKIFDSNIPQDLEKIDKEAKPKELIFFVGQGMVIHGLDKEIEGKELDKEYNIHISYKEAYGSRSASLIKTIPLKTFTDKNVNPQPGMVFALDNQLAHIRAVSGARVMIDLNHPLAGKDLDYKFKVVRKITDKKEKSQIFFKLLMPHYINEKSDIFEKENKIIIKAPKSLEQIINAIKQPFKELMGFDLHIEYTEEKREENKKKEENTIDENHKETI